MLFRLLLNPERDKERYKDELHIEHDWIEILAIVPTSCGPPTHTYMLLEGDLIPLPSSHLQIKCAAYCRTPCGFCIIELREIDIAQTDDDEWAEYYLEDDKEMKSLLQRKGGD